MRVSGNIRRAIAAALLAAVILGCLSGCGSTSSPKKVTQSFFSAVKSGDMEKAIECFQPSVQEQYKAVMALYSAFAGGADVNAILGGIVGGVNSEEYKNYSFKVSDVQNTDSEHAKVTVDVSNGGAKQTSTTVYCIKIDGKWYIEK